MRTYHSLFYPALDDGSKRMHVELAGESTRRFEHQEVITSVSRFGDAMRLHTSRRTSSQVWWTFLTIYRFGDTIWNQIFIELGWMNSIKFELCD
jgi:hypothetical protein